MKNKYFCAILGAAFLLFCDLSGYAQEPEKPKRNVVIVGAKKTAVIVGKGAAVVLKETGKAAWKTTKFAAANLAEPAANNILKPLVLKAAPKATGFMLKQTGNALQKGLPAAGRLLVTYLKYKLPI